MKMSYEELELALWRTNVELCRANIKIAELMQDKLIPLIQNREQRLMEDAKAAAEAAAEEKANG
jgi:hypothetical protein